MYSPPYAIEKDRTLINEVISENPFATIIYSSHNILESFHLPLILKDNKLTGHMSRANPAWMDIDQNSILVIFHGPHSYISPDWYGTSGNVPTWNYISIQVRGKVSITCDIQFLEGAITELAQKEDAKFDISQNVKEHKVLLKGIVGIEIEITDIFAKFKLAQSKSEVERENVILHLEKSSKQADHKVAKAMLKTLRK